MNAASWITTGVAALLLGIAPAYAAGAETAVVRIHDYRFVPATIKVKVGTTVKWINEEKRTSHDVWFKEEGREVSERFFPGESWQRTFDKPGTYRYVCGVHPEMHGVVEVTP